MFDSHYIVLKKKIKSIPITVLKFCLGTKFVTSYARTHAQTNFWITIPRVGLKALELIKKSTDLFLKKDFYRQA